MNKPEKMVQDKRFIDRLGTPDDPYAWLVGIEKVTAIVPYEENGEYAAQPWFAIYEGEHLAYRVNGKYVEVVSYQSPVPEDLPF